MTGARGRALAAVLLVIIAAAALAITGGHRSPSQAKPRLALVTSLPIVLGEDFSVTGNGSPALTALSARFRVTPISTTSSEDLAKVRLLLMAQPQVQTPENLVALDEWMRAGGRLLLLADPLLEWSSTRPLGDPLRPSPMFVDTGLLAHWGLRLDAPGRRGPAARSLAGYRIVTVSPGALYGRCAISDDRLVADCRIGKGRAIIVADADLLNAADLGPGAKDNLRAATQELAELANR